MKYSMHLISKIIATTGFLLMLVMTPLAFAAEFTPFGVSLLRYENETKLTNMPDRERLRLILQGGYKVKFNDSWTVVGGLSTGLKNKQNVPAITIKRFNSQGQPDSDIYANQLYVQYKNDSFEVKVGRVPWSFAASTDIFWDRNLNPYTVFFNKKMGKNHALSAAYIKPLDGEYGSVGDMFVSQYQFTTKIEGVVLAFQPWLVSYSGQQNAEYATRDTQFDHRSVRLAMSAKYNKWRVSMDLGYAFDVDDAVATLDANQDTSIVSQLTWGGIKQVNDLQWHVRYMHVEKFSVIREFAQNATAGAITNNFSGWDTRVRYRVHPKIWVGARFSMLENLHGSEAKSNRFRLEGRWSF